MGIPGLTGYLFDNPEVKGAWDFYRLENTRLVIDGLSLMGLLLRSSGCHGQPGDLRCGGQYHEFYSRVCDFFGQLQAKGVFSIIILDGVEEGDSKSVTLKKRVSERIMHQHTLANVPDQRQAPQAVECTVPAWCTLVMQEALINSGVPCITADGEADTVTAALARLWQCPVLSNDSDFFLFDLPGGLIHLRNLNVMRPGGWVRRFVRSRLLQLPVLSSLMHGTDERLLGLAAGLAGNDYVTGEDLQLVRRLYCRCYGSHSIVKALYWLVGMGNCRNVQSGQQMVEESLPQSVRGKVMTSLLFSVDFYDVTAPMRIAEATNLVSPPSLAVTSLRPNMMCGVAHFPHWVVHAFRLGGFPCLALNAAKHQRVTQTGAYLEDIREDPISKADLGVRSIIYGIVLGAGRRPPGANPLRVLELARGSGSTQVQEIRVIAARDLLPVFPALPSLSDVEVMDWTGRVQLLLHALDSLGYVEHLPFGWQLPVATLRHWICTAQRVTHMPRIYTRHVLTLLVGMVNSSSWPEGPQHAQLPHIKNYENLLRFLDGVDCMPVPGTNPRPASPMLGKLDVPVVHVFNQWQRIVVSAMRLNSILNFPLPWPQLHTMYNGISAYCTCVDEQIDEEGIRKLSPCPWFDVLYSAATNGLDVQGKPKGGKEYHCHATSHVSTSAATAQNAKARLEKQSLENAFAVLEVEDCEEQEGEGNVEELCGDTTKPTGAASQRVVRRRVNLSAKTVGGKRYVRREHRRKK